MFLSFVLTLCCTIQALALPAPSQPDANISTDLVERDNWSVQRDDLINGMCKLVTVIFARGTVEPGNVGTFAGPPFFNALADIIGEGNMAVQGVAYAASVLGYLEGGDPDGAKTLASLTNQAVKQCPNTQIILSGYSQGAQVVHLGVKQISADVASHVSGVVFFGDPDDGQALQNIAANKDDTYCFSDDLICDGLPIVLPAHLSYSIDAEPAAGFVSGLCQI